MMTMKHIATAVFITGLLGCNQQPKTESSLTNQVDKTVQGDSAPTTKKADNSKYYTTKDTLLIATENGDTLKFGKGEFNHIVDNHPELFSEYPQEPDQSYYCNADKRDFESEVGQDTYYVLYAYLLKQKNGVDNNKVMRKKLIDIYTNINSLFQRFQYGGTYFGHQYSRILGYAEYSIYLYSQSKANIEKIYDITKQKEFYIKSLRQLIDDESKIDNESLGNDKLARSKELNKIVDDLNKLITDNFYLRRTQEFHYGHYEYY
jgi:hypothetical protein